MADAKIRAIITAEDRASGVVKNFASNVESAEAPLARVGASAVRFGKLASVAFIAAGSAASKFAIDSAAEFEQNRIAFETMLGSAQAAKTMLKDFSDFAAKTPFSLPEVVEGGRRLLAMGIEAEKLLPTFKALGNIAAGVGKDKLPQLVLALGQVKAAGKLTGMELRQFTEAGVPLLAELAKVTGKTVSQIKEDMEGGAAPSFEIVEKAIFGMSQEGGRFFNLMDRQSKTLSGSVSNVKDNIGRLARVLVGINDEGDIRDGSIFAKLSEKAFDFNIKLTKLTGDIKKHYSNIEAAQNSAGGSATLLALSQDHLARATANAKLRAEELKIAQEAVAPSSIILKQRQDEVAQAQIAVTKAQQEFGINSPQYAAAADLLAARQQNLAGAMNESANKTLIVAGANHILKLANDDLGVAILQNLGIQMMLRDGLDSVVRKIKEFGPAAANQITAVDALARSVDNVVSKSQSITNQLQPALTNAQIQLQGVGSTIDRLQSQGNNLVNTLQRAGTNLQGKTGTAPVPGVYQARAEGGPVRANEPYIVGEKRPELFVPNSSGRIVPSLDGLKPKQSPTINITVKAGAFMGNPSDARKYAQLIAEALKDVAGAKNMTAAQMLS